MEQPIEKYDLVCIGGGIMSTTLALLCKLIIPEIKIAIYEKLDNVGLESSGAWNNAGTGHSAFCELNYTPMDSNGDVDIDKAVKVCHQFELSRQLWAHLVQNKYIKDPKSFIHSVPHHSWVKGKSNRKFLQKRYEAMSKHPFFSKMQYTEDKNTMNNWFPLLIENRSEFEELTATRMEDGVEVNFEALCNHYARILDESFDLQVFYNHEVKDIDPDETIDWTVEIENLEDNSLKHIDAEHVFIGAGGHSLTLLQKVEIEEKDGYGGFPVSGEWLVCKNQNIINQHHAKVYSKAESGSPPMSVPHLDTRFIDGKKELLFGPFAGFSTKFLKKGSFMDLFESIKWDNIPSMWGAFWHNLPLTSYLVEQVTMTHAERMDELRTFIRDAEDDEWELIKAGQRVQIIKKDEENDGTLEFGTEVVSSKDGNITALLGASPGASTAVAIMMEVIEKAFPEKIESNVSQWKGLLPFYKEKNSTEKQIFTYREKTNQILNLT